MKTAIDSSVLFDIVKGTADAEASLSALTAAAHSGVMCVSAPVVAELGRYFEKSTQLREFFNDAHIEFSATSFEAALTAAGVMHQYARNKGPRNRVSADFLIGAHAMVHADCLLTRDAGFYRDYFKGIKIINPTA